MTELNQSQLKNKIEQLEKQVLQGKANIESWLSYNRENTSELNSLPAWRGLKASALKREIARTEELISMKTQSMHILREEIIDVQRDFNYKR